jgi:hypothetical protein
MHWRVQNVLMSICTQEHSRQNTKRIGSNKRMKTFKKRQATLKSADKEEEGCVEFTEQSQARKL